MGVLGQNTNEFLGSLGYFQHLKWIVLLVQPVFSWVCIIFPTKSKKIAKNSLKMLFRGIIEI
jgi:hypothetical protein